MMRIVQQPDFSLGEAECVQSLAVRDSASILVISDSHGNRNAFFNILRHFGGACDALCFCGDGISDVCAALENDHVRSIFPPVLFFAKGNGDNSTATIVAQERLSVSVPTDAICGVCGKSILLTHGHKYNVYAGTNELRRCAAENGVSAVFYGHTHVANAQQKSAILLLNPGSCSLPRGNIPQTFAIATFKRDSEKIGCRYFRLVWSANGEIAFTPYKPPKGEVNLFW